MSCSTQEPAAADKEETLMPAKSIDSHICARCKDKRGVLVLVHTSYCRECLLSLLWSRFCRAVAPHLPALYPKTPSSSGSGRKASVLIASSGGSASAATVDMFHRAMCSSSAAGPMGRQRWKKVVVGWVDFGEEAEDRRAARESAMRRLAEERGFDFWRVSVDEAFDERGALLDPLSESPESSAGVGRIGIRVQPGRVLHTSFQSTSHPLMADSPYRALLAHLPPTSHPAMRTHILHSLLTRMAQSLGSSADSTGSAQLPPYLLLGPTSTRIASLTIASLALGRGYSLPLLVAPFLEYRGVKLIRPWTVVGKKELVWYARARGLETVDWEWESGVNSGSSGKATSIEALTQDFVQTLNSTHPATVSTIARTSHKLLFPGFVAADGRALSDKAKRDLWARGSSCALCELPSDNAPLDWLARTSITSLPESCDSQAGAAQPPPASPVAPIPIERQLCYACLTTLVSPSAFSGSRQPANGADEAHVPLPAWTLPNLVQETVKARRSAGGEPQGPPLKREEVGGWLKAEGWLLDEGDDDADP